MCKNNFGYAHSLEGTLTMVHNSLVLSTLSYQPIGRGSNICEVGHSQK